VRTRIRSVGWLVLLAACAPISTHGVIRDAETAIARAHAVDGDRVAPYEMKSAELYLMKAREEQGRAQYGAARDLARQSLTYAQQALERAGEKGIRAAPATGSSIDQTSRSDQPSPPTSRNP
jgi:hypothetical protein